MEYEIFSWINYLQKPRRRWLVKEPYPVLAEIPVSKLVERTKTVVDPLLGLIEQPMISGEYVSAEWGYEAYRNSFDKFDYGEAIDFINDEPDLHWFATSAVLSEVSYWSRSHMTPIQCVDKNMESTPGFPKFLVYDTEKDYLEKHGFDEYIRVFLDPDTLNKKPLWWTFLKNEVLKKKKVEAQDIRVITCTDPVYVRIGAVFDSVQNSMMKTRTETNHAQVGWSPFYGGLDKRVRRLAKHSNYVELDWTRFDGTIPPRLLLHVRSIRRFFLGLRGHMSRLHRWYSRNLVSRYTLFPSGEVTYVSKGNPSGQFSTTVDNNLVNEYLTAFEFGWLYRSQHGKLPTVEHYRSSVDFLCYGDDRLLSFDSGFVDYDPNEVIAMYKNVFGMWVKPENIKLSNTLEGLSFCGMKIVKTHGRYFGVFNADKLLTSLMDPVKRLPSVEALWAKLVSLRILLEHSDSDTKDYLNHQINLVEQFARSESIELPSVSADFYKHIW